MRRCDLFDELLALGTHEGIDPPSLESREVIIADDGDDEASPTSQSTLTHSNRVDRASAFGKNNHNTEVAGRAETAAAATAPAKLPECQAEQ